MMNPEAIFFDMDDTLLDAVAAAQESWDLVCSTFGPRLGCEQTALRDAIRREGSEFWKDEASVELQWRTRLLDAREAIVKAALETESWDTRMAQPIAYMYETEHRARLGPFDDTHNTLRALRDGGCRLGLITNGPRNLQRDKIQRFRLGHFFDSIVIEGEFGVGKPHPDIFRHALNEVGVRPDRAWHIGDNLYADIGGAQGAGIHAVWIHRDRLELKENTTHVPDRVVGHLRELPAIICD